ncbi:hypothetical protein [Corynebacterium phoceense]|nr:hypothetical protein [Corynebacterium phoceense]
MVVAGGIDVAGVLDHQPRVAAVRQRTEDQPYLLAQLLQAALNDGVRP